MDIRYVSIWNQLIDILEKVTERGQLKLPPMETKRDNLGRSIYQFIQKVWPFIINSEVGSFLSQSASRPSLIDFKLGRSINYSYHSNTWYHCW